ncbi:30S ribosomal protein S6 [bacterium]|nr:30S ribosomal protein S6 [bacterium]
MRKYEITYILAPELSDEAVAAKIDEYKGIIEKDGGTIVKIDNLGKRRLAYEINKKAEGFYVVMRFDAESAAAEEVRRVMKNSDDVLRSLLVCAEY